MRNQVTHVPLARLHRRRAASLSRHINTAKKADDSGGKHDVERWAETHQPSGLLTRDFIAKSLYNQDNGYFATKDVINDLPGPLEFRNMMGELHYRMDVKKAYESKLSAWMTPVETFSPHFSHALATWMTKEAKKTSTASSEQANGAGDALPRRRKLAQGRNKGTGAGACVGGDGESLVVYEAGGGTGTNALNVLDWLQQEEPKLYERTEYTIVEISPRLAELQTERVCSVHENCRVVNGNVLEWGMSGEVDPRPCFFLGMELLDNLPHDKIAWVAPSSTEEQGGAGTPQLCETVVVETPGGGFREIFRPVRDTLIRQLLTVCPELAAMVRDRRETESEPPSASPFAKMFAFFSNGGGGGRGDLKPEHCAAFIPTGSLRLVQALRARIPRHRAILADFDSFADSAGMGGGPSSTAVGGVAGSAGETTTNDESLTAFQAPIVSSRDPVSGVVTDHATYMVPLGSADIFFPTSFDRLSRLHSAICSAGGTVGSQTGRRQERVGRGRGLVVKQGEFLREFADLSCTRTFSGFNPLVDDFRNSSVFISGAVIAP
ncbi:unnamed protein product [Ectocarpus sp. 6 AP-2014]